MRKYMTNVYVSTHKVVYKHFPSVCIGCWSIEALSHSLKTQPSVIRKHVGFWVAQGILKECCTDRFSIVKQQQMIHKGTYVHTYSTQQWQLNKHACDMHAKCM